MPPWGPVKRRTLIASLRTLGLEGPFSGGKHDFMTRGRIVVSIPNPHRGDIGVGLLKLVLEQAGINRKAWEAI
jgi:predicted RNA binding protein YcfA (HicA-like mRNA interferase family)